MKEKIKKILKACKKSILFYASIYAIIFIVSGIILNAVGLKYRQYINYFSIILILVGIIAGLIQILNNVKVSWIKICLIICSVSIMGLIIMFSPIILLFIAFLPPEHVVEKDNKKYVAYVYSWLDTRVEYYEYINFLLVSKNMRIEDFYNDVGRDVLAKDAEGLFTPSRTTYYNKDGEIIDIDHKIKNPDTNVDKVDYDNQEYREKIEKQEEQSKIITPNSSDDILYEKEIDENTIIRIKSLGAILAQRSIIDIEKSTDGGKTYRNQIESSDGFIQIHDGAEFVFIDENTGFINDPGLVGTDGENRGLLVTTNGGKTFNDASIIHPDNIEEKNLFVKGVPYIENEILKVKIYTINYTREPEKIYYEFVSNDNGVTWKFYKEK